MKKISPDQFVSQIKHGLEVELQAAAYIAEQEKRVESYKQTLEDMQKVFEILNQPPFKGMLHSLIQSAVDVLIQKEAG